MFWYLAVFAALVGVSTTATAASYVAVTRFGVLERVLASILRRGLKGVTLRDAVQGSSDYKVTRIKGGVHVEQLRLAQEILEKAGALVLCVDAVSVESLQVTFPTWVAPFRLRVRGLKILLSQRCMPPHVEASDLAGQERETSRDLKTAKLQAIDRLLWSTKSQSAAPAPSSQGTYGSRLRARAVHRALAFCVQYVELDAEDVSCSYAQEHEPGPLPDRRSYLEGRDAAVVRVRRLSLAPQQTRPEIPNHLVERAGDYLDNMPACRASAEKELGASLPGMLRLFGIPSIVWRHLTLNDRRSTHAVISGVSLSLQAWGERQAPSSGPAHTQPVPISAETAPYPPSSFTASSPHTSSAAALRPGRLGPAEGAPPSGVRRKRLRVAARASEGASGSGGSGTAGEPSHGIPGLSTRNPGGSEEPPTETHVIVRQWGAEVTVAVLPPSFDPPKQVGAKSKQNVDAAERSEQLQSIVEDKAGERSTPVPSPFANQEEASRADKHPNGHANGHPNGPAAEREGNGADEDGAAREVLKKMDTWRSSAPHALGEPEDSPLPVFGCTVDVDIRLRALLPNVTPQSVAVAFRMLDRYQNYSQYSPYWQLRPQLPVSRSPGAWWQHAGSAAARECKLISRRQVPLHAIAARRANRLQYQDLYVRTHSRLASFKEPDRRWWQRRQTPKGGSEEQALLAGMEDVLSLEEIAHFRAGVAALHSSALTENPDHLRHAVDAVDAVVGNLGPLPSPVAAMLFQNEAEVQSLPVVVLTAAVACPKLGVILTIPGDRNPLTAPLPDERCSSVEASVTKAAVLHSASGEVRVSVESICVGGQTSVTHAGDDFLLRSPSLHANRMLQVADLHGVVSKARGFTKELRLGADKFLALRIAAEAGRWQSAAKPREHLRKHVRRRSSPRVAVEVKPPHAAVGVDDDGMNMRPPGMLIVAELAGIEVEYNKNIVLAALNFARHLGQLKDRPLQSQPPQRALPQLVVEPGQPVNLSERVFHAFAQQNMPVYKPLSLPITRIRLSCPGLVIRVPYDHMTTVGVQERFTDASKRHELIAAVTRMRVERSGEDFREFMRTGASQRSTLHAYVDLFCYQPPSSRRRLGDEGGGTNRKTAFGNRTISGQRQGREGYGKGLEDSDAEGDEGVDSEEMAAMAKVWAHPEDLHKYPGVRGGYIRQQHGSFSGTPMASFRPSTASSRAKGLPAFPMIPLLKISGIQAEVAEKVHSLPAAPGSHSVSAAVALHGIMFWISPWQVAHLLSIADTIKRDLPHEAAQPHASAAAADSAQKTGQSAMRTQLQVQVTLEVPLISAICSIARSPAEFESAISRRSRRTSWGNQISETDPAFLWAHCVAPAYGVNVLGIRCALSFRGTGHLRGGITIDGLLVRDLQLPPSSKFAFFLRPLPARACELTQHATKFRTQILRVVSTSVANRRWRWAVRKVVLRARSSKTMAQLEAQLGSVRHVSRPFTSFVGLKTTGPQLVACCYVPPAQKWPGHPDYRPAPPAKLNAQVGQLLLYARVSSNNRMLPFCSQIIEMITGGGHAAASASGSVPGAKKVVGQGVQAAGRQAGLQQSGARFAGLTIELGMVGMDLKIVVQGRELVSMQLLDANLSLALTSDPPPPVPDVSSMVLGLRIVDISIRDLQAILEHSTVLRPNRGAEHCSLALDYSQPLNPQQAALLVIEMANPRVLALFRFVYDIIHGVDIINTAFARNGGIFPSAGASAPIEPASRRSPPPEILVHLTNAGIVLPASSKSLKVLVADVDYVMFGMPGDSLSDNALNTAGLPSVRAMLRGCQRASCLFKQPAKGGKPTSAFSAAPAQQNPIPRAPVPPTPQAPKASARRKSTKPADTRGPEESGPGSKGKGLGEAISARSQSLTQALSAGGHQLVESLRAGSRGLQSGSSRVQAGSAKTWGLLKQKAGVLFLDDGTLPSIPEYSAAGVLQIDIPRDTPGEPSDAAPAETAPRPSAEADATPDAAERDRGGEASTSGRAADGTPRGRGVSMSRDSERPHFVGSRAGPRVQLPEKIDVLRGIDAPLPGDDPLEDGDKADEEEDLPAPQLAIFAEVLVISRASLRRTGKGVPPKASFCPISVSSFAWPLLEFITVDRHPFIQPSSYGLVLFEGKAAGACSGAYTQLHLAAAPVVAILNAPNYTALLGFAQGNLLEISSFEGAQARQQQKEPQRTRFNPAFKFGLPSGDLPTFRMTAELPKVTTVFEADPQYWQSGAIRSRLGDPADISRLPFLRASVLNVQMDLVVLEKSGATYMAFRAGGANCDDLRLAYSKIMTEYEVIVDDELSDLPQGVSARAYTSIGNPGWRTSSSPEEIAQEAAVELSGQLPSQSCPPDGTQRNRRERSGEVLRMKSIQIQRAHDAQLGAASSAPGNPRPPQPSAGEAPVPLVDMEVVSSLEAYFPAGSPVVHLLKAPAAFPATEAEHLASRGRYKPGTKIVQATIALQKDGTVAVEVDLSLALLQWPFLTDISLVWAAASVFAPGPPAQPGADPATAAASSAMDAVLNSAERVPWIYLNIILQDSQFFLPVADPDTLLDGVKHYFGGGAAAMNLHERLADLLLMQLAFSMEDPDMALRIEERGVAITWSALRVSYAMGGDGNSDIRADLRHLAAFVRDPGAVVSCLLLPFSCSMHLEMQIPQAQEREQAKRQQRAVTLIQRSWRRRRWQRAAERSRASGSRHSEIQPSEPPPVVLSVSDAARRVAKQASKPLPQSQRATDAALLDQLVQEVASPRTHALLKEYYEQAKAAGSGLNMPKRDPSSTYMRVKLGSCTFRAAFSHVPFIQALMWMTKTMILQPSPGNLTADSNHPTTQSAFDKEVAAREFRPSMLHVEGTLQSVSLVLCNDKPQTFGAPDVLQLSTDQVTGKYVMHQHFHDRPPDQVAEASMRLYAQFLNNSSSRWEAICENWQLQAELVDRVSPIYRSDFQRHIWLTSKQHLSVHFNPSALLSVGDLLAFVNALQGPMPNIAAVIGGQSEDVIGQLGAPEAAPHMLEQMAQRGSITSRVPQKYLVQNQSGLRVYYWADKEGEVNVGPLRTHSLDSGVSETLKVTPQRKVLSHVSPGHGGIGKLQNVINLHVEGNWMPIKDVAVSVVGKYRYHMYSPAEHDRVPVIVDIILVGRTKIITLHSGIWLENRMDRKVSFRLHVPITPLVAPGLRANARQTGSDNEIGPLKPGGGMYLPVTAVLGGQLFVRPSGFQEARRDVIRLSPSIADIKEQQGHISCDPMSVLQGGPAVQAPLHCSLLVRLAQVNSEFQAFKHIEMLAPGEFSRASESLEATLAIHPTLVLTNALPYVMEVIVWQVAPFRKLREAKTRGRRTKVTEYLYYDWKQMRAAFTGSVPILGEANPYNTEAQEQEQVQRDAAQGPSSPSAVSHNTSSAFSSEESEESDMDDGNKLQRQQRRQGRKLFTHTSRNRLVGEHISVTLAPGVSQNVYADMDGNVLVHVAIPALGMVATHWAVVSWAKSQVHRESIYDAKYIYRLPKEIQLRNVDSQPGAKRHPNRVNEYVASLKSAGRKFRSSAHRRRKDRVEAQKAAAAAAADGGERRGSHIKYPSEGTPVGPVVPTVLPQDSLDPTDAAAEPDTPRGSSRQDPAWFNALYGSPGTSSPDTASPAESGSPPNRGPAVRSSNIIVHSGERPSAMEVASSSGRGLMGGVGPGYQLTHSQREAAAAQGHVTTSYSAGGPRTPGEKGFLKSVSRKGSREDGAQPSRVAFAEQGLPGAGGPGGGWQENGGSGAGWRETGGPMGVSSAFSQLPAGGCAVGDRLGEIQPAGAGDGPVSGDVLEGSAGPGRLGEAVGGDLGNSSRGISDASTSGRDLDAESLGFLRAAFDAWRAYSVKKATGKLGSQWQHKQSGMSSPELLLLGIHNSLAASKPDEAFCRLSFSVPYWVDNRTSMDLLFQDHASATPNPLLLGMRAPMQYSLVAAPSIGLVQSETPGGTHRSFWDISDHQEIEVQPTLLNKQDVTRFCLASVNRRQFSPGIHINTVGLKGSIRVRGPMPSQSVHLAQVVQEGMRAMFANRKQGERSDGDSEREDAAAAPEPPTIRELHRISTRLSERPGVLRVPAKTPSEHVKVSIVPLVCVSISGLQPRDSDEAEGAALDIHPRGTESGQEPVSLVLEVVPGEPEEQEAGYSGDEQRNEGVRLDAVVLDPIVEGDELAAGSSHTQRLQAAKAKSEAVVEKLAHLQLHRPPALFSVGQREYEFAAEVTPAPPNSVFRHTKVVTIKAKYVLDNQTGMPIEVKQRGTPDLDKDPSYGSESRCSCWLDANARSAFHWDNAELEKVLVVRPLGDAADGGDCEWEWSGGFTMSTREEYFGLRVRHKTVPSRAINIPVNSTVGPSGCVLVTFKSRFSVPPYRIENKTSDVVVYFAQSAISHERGMWNWLTPEPGGSHMAYAWDEPTQEHNLQVQAHVQNRLGRPFAASFALDKLGTKQPLNLPSATKTFNSSRNLERVRTLQRDMSNVPDSLKERVASVLASEFSKKVYVTVFADGPTRVLRFSDEPNTVAVEAEQSILDLAARLKQVEADLSAVDGRFLQLHGPAGGAELDLYGRAAALGVSGADREDRQGAAFHDAGRSSAPARIRLRQRGMVGVYDDGSPMGMPSRTGSPRIEISEGNRSQGPSQPGSATSSMRRPMTGDRLSLSLPSRMGHDPAVQDKPGQVEEIVRPKDLGHHLANLHVPASSHAVQGSQLMKSGTAADSALLLGGDLLLTVWQAERLEGNQKVTHPFARVRVGEQSQLTSVQWQSLNPVWDETLNFRDVSAAAELLIELWDVGGSRGAKQLQKLATDPASVIANARFLGSVDVPLSRTLAMSRGSKHWFTLMRRTAADSVAGRLRLSFAWDVTAASLLNLKLAAVERVLAQRTEILCMLNPVEAATALGWAKEDREQASTEGPESPHGENAVEHSEQSSTRQEERSLADMLLAKHMHEEHHSTLNVSVLEARGLHPRRGVVVAFQSNQLPNPVVQVDVPGHDVHEVKASHTINPRFDQEEPASYKHLSSDSRVTVRMYDRKGRNHLSLLGEATISCSRLKGTKPMYIWLPLLPSARERGRWGMMKRDEISRSMGAPLDNVPELQVHLRLQWVRHEVRGQYMNAEVSLAGLGLIVMGGLQDELFNLTVDNIKLSGEQTLLEARLKGSIKRIQLDNQMLDATQPVVLAPASVAHAHSKTAQSLLGGDRPLIEFGIARSFAYSVRRGGKQGDGIAPAGNRERGSVGRIGREEEGMKLGEGTSSILSFKEIFITIAELDFQADDGFLEAILSFAVSIPMADVWQDDAWRAQQRRLLTAQFGPKEVESLSMNTVLPLDADPQFTAHPLEWMQAKELHELQVLRDQSSYSSWYFIERAYIGDINANVTIALTSSVLATRQGAAAQAAAENSGGLFSRFIGASGFQLINVNNVPLSLGSWSLDTKLIGRKALANTLARHYFAQSVQEAHKVLGGAGPAIAAVPLTVVWVGGSFITLLGGISSGRVGPVGAAQRVGFVFFMSVAQVVSSLSRIGLSLMTYAPPNRTGHFSDSRALTRAVQRPANAFEAFGRAWEELFDATMSAIVGVLLDPTQGYHTGGFPIALAGVAKGMFGIAVRPTVGLLELVSKGTHGMGLVCLGREAITGSTQRRVRAPGALADEMPEAAEESRMPEVLAQQRNIILAWQASLPHMFPHIKDDTVMEVINTHAARTLLLCKGHVALVRSKRLALRSTYKAMWAVPVPEIKIVRGDDDKLRINLEHAHKLDAKCFGVWTIPRSKSIKCGSRDLLERIIVKINRHMSNSGQGRQEAADNIYNPCEASDLTIFDGQYAFEH